MIASKISCRARAVVLHPDKCRSRMADAAFACLQHAAEQLSRPVTEHSASAAGEKSEFAWWSRWEAPIASPPAAAGHSADAAEGDAAAQDAQLLAAMDAGSLHAEVAARQADVFAALQTGTGAMQASARLKAARQALQQALAKRQMQQQPSRAFASGGFL